jgi:hypothetical protein
MRHAFKKNTEKREPSPQLWYFFFWKDTVLLPPLGFPGNSQAEKERHQRLAISRILHSSYSYQLKVGENAGVWSSGGEGNLRIQSDRTVCLVNGG